MQTPGIVTYNDQAAFSQEMLETLLAEKFTKTEIAKQTGISLSAINRVLSGKTKTTTAKHFKKLLSFYYWMKLEKEKNEAASRAITTQE